MHVRNMQESMYVRDMRKVCTMHVRNMQESMHVRDVHESKNLIL